MKKIFFLCFMALISLAFAQEKNSLIQLEGEVVIEHPLATLCAQKIDVVPSKNSAEPFSKILLEGNIRVIFKNNLTFFCEKGEIDFEKKIALFTSAFSCTAKFIFEANKNEEPEIIYFSSPEFALLLDKNNNVEEIVAKKTFCGSVKEYLVVGEKCVYQLQNQKLLGFGLPQQPCLVTKNTGEILSCQEFEISLLEHSSIISSFFYLNTEATAISAEKAYIEEINLQVHTVKKCQLRHNSCIWLADKAAVKSDEINVEVAKKGELLITTYVKTFAIFSIHGDLCRLVAPGGLSYNLQTKNLQIFSDKKNDKQISLKNRLSKMAANECELFFSSDFNFEKALVRGNVTFIAKEKNAISSLKAEQLDYHFPSKNLLLTASPGKKVAIFDGKNNMLAEAPFFSLTYDDKNNPFLIGRKDVRFHLLKEKNLFKEECMKAFEDN